MSRRTSSNASYNLRYLDHFFQGWLVRQENYRQQLRSAALRNLNEDDDDLRDLVGRVLAHYQQYYEEKSRMANHDVWLVFSPPWFSCFEQSFLWIAGFKPGLAFRIVGASVEDMSREQAEMMERLRAETSDEERKLEKELAEVQESVATLPMVEVTRRINNNTNTNTNSTDHISMMDREMEALRGAMEVVVAKADMLRTRTAERVVEILTPLQNVKFLSAVTDLQIKIRIWGCQLQGNTPPASTF